MNTTLKEKLIERIEKMQERKCQLEINMKEYKEVHNFYCAADCKSKAETFDIVIEEFQKLIN